MQYEILGISLPLQKWGQRFLPIASLRPHKSGEPHALGIETHSLPPYILTLTKTLK